MGHEYQDACSLEVARRVAAGLSNHPEWIILARDNIARWRDRNADAPSLLRCYDEWAALLDLPVRQICDILTANTDEGQRLRQNTPFAGILSPQEVWDIKRRFSHDQNAA